MSGKLFLTLLFAFGIYGMSYADWTEPIQVNDSTYRMQATRDGDTPWAIAADDSGNVLYGERLTSTMFVTNAFKEVFVSGWNL